jgi:RecA-family ATPase
MSETRNLLAGLRNGAWLDKQSFDPLQYHVPGVIPEGSSLLVGPPKIGKSWFVLAVALAVASGGRVLGLPVEQRPVLYLALEDGHRRLQDRCRKLLGDDPIPAAFAYLTRVEPGSVLETVALALDQLPDGGAAPLVIIDTLAKVMPPAIIGESSYGRDYRVGAALKHLVDDRPGAAIAICHHDRKANADGDFVDAVSGTHGLAGAADTVVVVDRKRHETTGLLKVTGRDVNEDEYAVRFERGTWSLSGGALEAAADQARQARATTGLGDRSVDILDFVARHGHVRARDVEARFGPDGSRYLRRLADAGRLVRVARGLYALPVPLSEVSEVSGVRGNGTGQPDGSDTPTGEQLELLTNAFGDGIQEVDE